MWLGSDVTVIYRLGNSRVFNLIYSKYYTDVTHDKMTTSK